MVYLHELPVEHTLRNIPLAWCWYRWVNGKDYRQVQGSFGIAKRTYNQLDVAWTKTSVFCWEPIK
jgi:hypothetical protein